MKKRLQNTDVKNKTVVLRVDYNVPMRNNQILDDTKIKETLETINYLLDQNCKIVILSHLGKVKTEKDKETKSLRPVGERLSSLLGRQVYFSELNYGIEVYQRVKALKPQELILLENTRFLDLPNKLESNCDPQLSEFFASLGDVFVNDAFASSHRKHASTYGISMYLETCIGFLMQKEIDAIDKYILNATHPFTIVMGGSKIDDKLSLIKNLLPKCDHMLLGGGIANSALYALGFEVGESLVNDDPEIVKEIQDLLLKYKDKIVLPFDAIVGSTYDPNYVKYKRINEIGKNDMINDIGTITLQEYEKIINQSSTIFINGTMGIYEDIKFANGTKELLSILARSNKTVIAGGGDAASSVKNLGYKDKLTYVCSGGGATLEYISLGHLKALENVKDEEEVETLEI